MCQVPFLKSLDLTEKKPFNLFSHELTNQFAAFQAHMYAPLRLSMADLFSFIT